MKNRFKCKPKMLLLTELIFQKFEQILFFTITDRSFIYVCIYVCMYLLLLLPLLTPKKLLVCLVPTDFVVLSIDSY